METFLSQSRSLLEDFIGDIPHDTGSERYREARKKHVIRSAFRFQQYLQVLWDECRERNSLTPDEVLGGMLYVISLQEHFLMTV